jgi:predicted MFS family arabinose efflux permease/quinol monooxygenase YgiN
VPAGPSDPAAPTVTLSPWAPLRGATFRVLWAATLLANIGTWVRDVGSGWLMTSLSPSALAVSLVQVATTLPIFLLSLPAGVLADLVDRRHLLIALNLALAAVSLGMAWATHAGHMTAAGLVASLLAAGIATALIQPVQQSLTPLMVGEPSLLRPAIALNSLGFNVSRAIGPALGGLLIGSVGVAAAFAVDALSYLGLIAALWWWQAASTPAASGPPERFAPALRGGLRFALHAPALRRILLRAMLFFGFASAYWALLPLIARRELGGGAGYYGIVLASIGVGAVIGAVLLPKLRKHLSAEATLRAGTVITIACLLGLAASRDRVLAAAVLALAGAAWIAVLTTANVAAQTSLPNWVRGRGLALYLTLFYGAMAAGSLAWGALADALGVRAALACAALAGALGLLVAWRRPVSELEPDLRPAMHWPEPVLDDAHAADRRGPVMVTVEYLVEPAQRDAFLAALHAFAPERLRDGALQWDVFEDAAQPGRFVEMFLLPSWDDHLRQHARVSQADAALQRVVQGFPRGAAAPKVEHWIGQRSGTG